jgi:hypothetical protein
MGLRHLGLILLHEMPSASSDWTAREPPLSLGGSDDEAADTNRVPSKSASRAEARNLGVSMPQPIWALSGTDDRCDLCGPGHLVHWIHFNHSMREPGAVTPVTAAVAEDGLVHIEGNDESMVRWNHRPAVLRDALHRFGGMAVWKPRWHLLAVATEAFLGGARSVFNLATPDQKRACYTFRSINSDRLVANTPSPTDVPPLRIAPRYA